MRGGKDTIGALDQKNVARAHHPGSDVSKLSESHWRPRSPLIQAPLHCTERRLQTCAGRFPEDSQEKQCFPESLINTLIWGGEGFPGVESRKVPGKLGELVTLLGRR